MNFGDYRVDSVLGSSALCSRYVAFHGQGTEPVELRWLHGLTSDEQSFDRSAIQRHLRRITLIDSPFVRRAEVYPSDGDIAYVVMPLAEPDRQDSTKIALSQSLDACCQFIEELTMGLLAAHRMGVIVGPVAWELISRSNAGHWQWDSTGLLSHLSVGQDESLAKFRFAAPESQQERLCDSLSDTYSFGQFLQCLLSEARFAEVDAARAAQLTLLVAQLMAPDAAERLWLSQFLSTMQSWVAGKSGENAQGSTEVVELANLNDTLAVNVLAVPSVNPLVRGHQSMISHSATDVTAELSLAMVERTQGFEQQPSASVPQVLRPSSQLGRFEIEEKLGEGGMGAVYKARDLADGSPVALKVLHWRVLGNPQAVRRFAKEARLLAQARNPYIANLLETSSEGETAYMAVEYVAGGSLGGALKPGQQLELKFALAVVADIARGLTLAHDRGIVHRDIKPDNILLTESGRDWLESLLTQEVGATGQPSPRSVDTHQVLAKLADFGIARTEHQSESMAMTRDNALLGTPLYMAPEQCLGAQVDARADIYALGITLYQMLAGRTPFQADSNVALMAMHANEPPPALKNWRSDLPESIELVVDKCLAKNPDTRYSHGRELLLDLENLLRGQPTSIGLHPPLIARRGDHVLTFEHTWDLRSSPAALWPYVSHTDRVNHAIGLTAVNYTTHNDPVHGVQRTAEAMIAGQRIRWQEHPYEWIEGKRLSVLREFIQGPFDWFVNIVQLHPRADGGTQIVQTLQVAPRGWLGKVLAKFQLGAKSRRSFGAVYQQIDHYLQQQQSSSAADDPWGNRHELTTSQRARLNQRMEVLAQRGAEPAVLEVLRQLLEHGSELEVARIRPLALAQQRQVDPQRMLEACLLGAHEGLLLLLWDILCPSCRIPSDVVDTLAALKDHAHCQACNVQFELDFGRSIELIFRAHPELRHAETKTYCIGGPAWSRHVVAQVRLAAGERFACDLALESGAYVLRGPQLPYTIPFRVGSSSTQSRWEVALARAPSADDATGSLSSGLLSSSSQSVSLQSVGSQSAGMPIMLRPDQQAIWLWNDSPRDLEVRIERVASRHDAVTAAAASSTALFRELFGDQVLSSGQLISVAHITLLLVKLCDTGERYRRLGDAQAFTEIRRQLESINRVVRERGGAVIKMIGEAVVATFTTPLAAMEAAAMLCAATDKSDSLPMGSVVQSGPAVVTTLDDRLDYFGRLVHDALSCLDNAQPEKILTSVSVVALPDVQLWLAERQGVVGSVSELPDMAVPVVFIAVPTVTTKP